MYLLLQKIYPGASERPEISDLEQGIETLPRDHCIALRLHYGEQLSRKEIAAQLGWSLSKVNQKITRGITLLKFQLDPEYFEEMNK